MIRSRSALSVAACVGGRPPCRPRAGLALLLALALGPAWLALPARAQTPSGREIMQRVNDRDDGDNQTSELEMTLIDRRGSERVREIRSSRKDFGKDTHSLMFFLAPADVKNTGFLSYDYDAAGKDDDQWLYLPALRKTKRIASGDKSGSFMGSDFNYSDMTRPDLEQYTFTVMKRLEENGTTVWQLEVVPRSATVAEDTGYAKSIVFVRDDISMVIRGVRWVNKSRRLKYMTVDKLERIDGIWVAAQLRMVTKEGQETVHSTVLRFKNIRFNQRLSPDLFTVRSLEKGP